MILASSTGVKAHVSTKLSQRKKPAGKGREYVLLEIMGMRYLLTPAEAFRLSNQLTDAAEQIENTTKKETHP